MARESAPGGLGVEPGSAVEAFALQEAVRYREALLAVERLLMDGMLSPAGRCMRALVAAQDAIQAGDEAAG